MVSRSAIHCSKKPLVKRSKEREREDKLAPHLVMLIACQDVELADWLSVAS